jgi:hypothetical protein
MRLIDTDEITKDILLKRHIAECKKRIDIITEYMLCSKNSDNDECKKTIKTLNAAVSSLKKQIPMKPILKNGQSLIHSNYAYGHGETKVEKWQEWVCPVCGWFVGERYNCIRNGGSKHSHDQRRCNFCNECGQRIDWSERK